MVIDDGLLLDFGCYPERKANNVNWLHYRRPDGTTFAVAKQVTRGVWSKLAALTGMNEGNDKRFDVAADGADSSTEIRVVCQVGNSDAGSHRAGRAPGRHPHRCDQAGQHGALRVRTCER